MIFSLTYHKIKNVGNGSSTSNDFRLFFFFFPLPTALAVGFLWKRALLPQCLLGACYVEGLQEPEIHRIRGRSLVLWL